MEKHVTGINDLIEASLERPARSEVAKALFASIWKWEHWRDGELIDKWADTNICTDEGLNNLLDVHFSKATQITEWYALIYNTDTTPVAGMTYAVKSFTESTHYSEATRPLWQEGGVSSKSIDNSANKASFTISTSETIYGAALVGGGSAATTKGDSAGGGVVYNVSDFSGGSKTVASDDVLKVTVTLQATDV
jgi:hypothetical protein